MLDLWPVPNVGVADRGLREGLLVTMMEQIQRRQQKRRRGRRGKERLALPPLRRIDENID